MRLLKTHRGKFIFHLDQREEPLLQAVLRQYPLIPPAHQRLSRTVEIREDEAYQRLLDEALAEQRRENKRQLQALLADPQCFQTSENGCRMTLSVAGIEWLLQVLNDVRVGSWVRLGSPEKDLWDFELNETTAPQAWTMEMAGYFQAHLLEALQGGGEV